MCVIIACPNEKKRPSLEILQACEKANPHGGGFAWREKGMVRYLKGLNAGAIHKGLSLVDGPVIIHFRIATVGGRKAELCHPFPVSKIAKAKTAGRARAVLFHNGTWRDWGSFVENYGLRLKRDMVSDTRVAAIACSMFGFEWLKKIPNRFAVLSKRGIRIVGDWKESDGIHYSNLDWRPRAYFTDEDLFSGAV